MSGTSIIAQISMSLNVIPVSNWNVIPVSNWINKCQAQQKSSAYVVC